MNTVYDCLSVCICASIYMYVCGKEIYRMFTATDLLLEELGLSSESSQNKSENSVPAERGVRQSQKKTRTTYTHFSIIESLFLNFYIKNK